MKISAHGYKIIVILGTVFFMAAFIFACDEKNKHEDTVKYQCPMHPTYIDDKPGSCPICGMDTVPIEKSKPEASDDEKNKQEDASKYQCPMHPTYIDDKPGSCPICGMDTVLVEKSSSESSEKIGEPEQHKVSPSSGSERKILFYRNPMDPSISSPVPARDEMGMEYVPVYADEVSPAEKKEVKGFATVTIDEKGIYLSGVQVAEAVRQPMEGDIRAVGMVKADETRMRHVHTKSSGWIDKLYVNTTGQLVKTGQRLLTIYSPQLLASQEEFLSARENALRFAGSSVPEVRKGGEDILKAARKRLELLDVPESLIREIEKTGKPQRTVTLLAPVSGFVTVKQVYEGQQVEPGMELYTITDLSQVWIEADFYEFESHLIRVGQKAVFSFSYDSTREISGRVSYIYPYLDPQSRTIRARFTLQNSDFSLKPEMYVNVSMKVAIAESVVIPDSAVMNTGLRQIVFVGTRGDQFEPREVKTGSRSRGLTQVLSGVEAGEKVVVRANFLLDSESRLRAAIQESAKAAEKGAGGGK